MDATRREWSAALMATSGFSLPIGDDRPKPVSPDIHEAGSDGVERDRLAALALHRKPEVRAIVAARGDCPLGLLITLAHDAKADVRVAVAANERAAESVLAQLATDRDARVARAVAHNPAASQFVVAILAGHREPSVRRAATARLNDANSSAASDPWPPVAAPELEDTPSLAPTGEVPAVTAPEEPRRVLAPRPTVGRA